MRFNVKRGSVEIPTSDPSLRSFLIPSPKGNRRINVWATKSGRYTVGICGHRTKRNKRDKVDIYLYDKTEDDVRSILAGGGTFGPSNNNPR